MEKQLNELAKLTVEIEPDALRTIIANGRLLEFADTVAKEAAAQISAQIVNRVSAEALRPEGLKTGVAVAAYFILDDGDFGTVPPRPKWGVVRLNEVLVSPLRRLAAVSTEVGG